MKRRKEGNKNSPQRKHKKPKSRKKRKFKNKIPPHHIIPTSRGGSKKDPFNIIYPPEKLHIAYHILFRNKIPYQILNDLRIFWFDHDEKIHNYFNKKNDAYKLLFGEMTPEDIESYLKEHWFNPITSKYQNMGCL